MRRTRRTTRTARGVPVGLALAGLLLSACSGQLTPGSGGDADAGSGPVSTQVPEEKVRLDLAFTNSPDMVEALAEAYQAEHPNVTIDTEYTEFDDYVKNIKLVMSSDDAPDLAQFNSGAMQSLIKADHLVPLDRYDEAYGWQDRFPPVGLEQLSTNDDGRVFGTGSLYAVPAGMSLVGVYYNKDLARQAGVTEPPATLEEFETALAKAKDAGQTPLAMGALDYGALHLWGELVNVMMPPEDYRSWVYGQKGGSIETDGAREAAETVASWAEKGYFSDGANGTSENDAAAKFAQGKSTFLVNGNWAAAQVDDALGDDAGFFAMPPVEAGGPATGNGYSVGFSVSSHSEHPDVAANFLDFLASPKAAEIVSENGFLPVNVDAAPQPDGVLGDLATAYADVVADDGIQQFPDASAPAMLDELTSGLQQLIAGRTTAPTFLSSLQQVWTSYRAG
jgi:ABC-type glycerol-3-phosphate transport system substrate-binding protein